MESGLNDTAWGKKMQDNSMLANTAGSQTLHSVIQHGVNFAVVVSNYSRSRANCSGCSVLTHNVREPLFLSDFDKICRAAYFRSKWNSPFL